MTTFDPLVFLDKAEDWVKVVDRSKTAQLQGGNSHIPISNFDLGIRIQPKFIVVLVNVNYRKSTWSYAGQIRQSFNFPATNEVQYKPTSLRINTPQLIGLENVAPGNFGLIYFPPEWFKDLNIKVWSYTGEVLNFGADALFNIESAVTDGDGGGEPINLTEILTKLQTLEDKINLLL